MGKQTDSSGIPLQEERRRIVHTMRKLGTRGLLCMACLMASPVWAAADGQKFPDVVSAVARVGSLGKLDFDVTVSSPYDSAARYADAFKVMGKDGTVYGERTLWHDHADEQPFTRDLYGVAVPASVNAVVIQARDKKFGYGGKTVEIRLPKR